MKLCNSVVVQTRWLAVCLAGMVGMAQWAVAYDSPELALQSDGWNEVPAVTSVFESSFPAYSGKSRIVILSDDQAQGASQDKVQAANSARPLARFHREPQPASQQPLGQPLDPPTVDFAYASAEDTTPNSRPIVLMAEEVPLGPRDPQGFAPPAPPGQPPLNLEQSPSGREPEKLGEEPVDNSRQFLRRVAVTLPAGQRQYDLGISYILFEDDFPDIAGNLLIKSRIRQRLLVAPLAFRMGVTDRLQAFINAPVGWIGTEISSPGLAASSSNGGIGDTNVGLSYWLKQSDGCCFSPDVIASFAVTAPTGDASFEQAILSSPIANLGQGFWALQWNVLFVQTYDPVTLFYGFGSRHRLERDFGATSVAPGGQYNYQFGVGFAVNEHITLSTAFLGSYISDLYLDDVRIPGTLSEPLRLRFAATMSKHCRIVEPFAEIGMTSDAPAASVGVTWTY